MKRHQKYIWSQIWTMSQNFINAFMYAFVYIKASSENVIYRHIDPKTLEYIFLYMNIYIYIDYLLYNNSVNVVWIHTHRIWEIECSLRVALWGL